MIYELYLPFPPSNNSYYVKTRNGVFISKAGRAFRQAAAEAVLEQGMCAAIGHRICVQTVYFMPDRRKRDIANYSKALHDALTHAGLWEDDELIDQHHEYRGERDAPKGSVFMRISPAESLIPVGSVPPGAPGAF